MGNLKNSNSGPGNENFGTQYARGREYDNNDSVGVSGSDDRCQTCSPASSIDNISEIECESVSNDSKSPPKIECVKREVGMTEWIGGNGKETIVPAVGGKPVEQASPGKYNSDRKIKCIPILFV